MRARLLANLNWLAADRVLRLVGGLLVGVWVARYLGPEQYGALNYALAFVALFGAVAKLGMDQIVVRGLVLAPDQEGKILGTLFGLKLCAGLIASALAIGVAWPGHSENPGNMLLVFIIALGLVFNAADAFDVCYQARLLSRYTVIARSAAFLVFMLVRIALILGEFSVAWFAAATTLELALGGLLLAWPYLGNKQFRRRWLFDMETMSGLLKDGWPLIVSSALIVAHIRISQVMLGHMLGNAELGVYSAAVRLSEAWLFIPSIIVQTVMPYFVQLRTSNPLHYQRRLIQLYSIMFWLGVAAGVLAILFGEALVMLLFGERYRAAYAPLCITIWTGIFVSQGIARGIWMIGENRQGYRLVGNLIVVPMNIALNLLLIPQHGVVGAALASFVSMGVGTWIIPFLFPDMRESNRNLLRSINPKYLFIRN